jgi:hypothetical protein
MPLGRHLFRNQRTPAIDKATATAPPIDATLTAELRTQLEAVGEIELIGALADLRVVERCTCDDPRCESFYTLPRFQTIWLWNRGGRTIPLSRGLAIDAVGDRIVAVEIIRDNNGR